jgi:hypothetical protein
LFMEVMLVGSSCASSRSQIEIDGVEPSCQPGFLQPAKAVI